MKRCILFAASLAASLFAAQCSAGIFERDWNTPGDGLLTYDDVNQREWLDLSVSRIDQFPQPWLANAIEEVQPGGMFDEFTFAKRSDVIAFAKSAGIDTSTDNYAINEAPVAKVIDLLGRTFQTTSITSSVGYIDERVGSTQFYAFFGLLPNNGGSGSAGLYLTYGIDGVGRTNGLMLYRVVPEPSAILLSICGASLLLATLTRQLRR